MWFLGFKYSRLLMPLKVGRSILVRAFCTRGTPPARVPILAQMCAKVGQLYADYYIGSPHTAGYVVIMYKQIDDSYFDLQRQCQETCRSFNMRNSVVYAS